MVQSLIVYFSRTGSTKSAAMAIARALDGELDEIVDHTPRAGLRGYMRCAVEATLRRPAKIEATKRPPYEYDLVILGTPVWNASVASPMLAYVEQHRDELKNVAFFCTYGGRGETRVMAQLERLTGKKPAAMLTLREDEVSRGSIDAKVERFAERIRDALHAYHEANAATPAPAPH